MKKLICRIKSKAGRSRGKITTARRHNPIRRMYHFIDFERKRSGKAKLIQTQRGTEKSPTLGILAFENGFYSYILLSEKMVLGDFVFNKTIKPSNVGDSAQLKYISSGSLINTISRAYIRSSGCSAILIRKEKERALLKLKSGELRYFSPEVIAALGVLSNSTHFLKNYKKAGTKWLLGRRPRNRPLREIP